MQRKPIHLSLARVLDVALEYQSDPRDDLFSLLLIRFDDLLLKTIHKVLRYMKHLHGEPMQELYHTAIIGLSKSMLSMKPDQELRYIPARVVAYVKEELKNTYRYKLREVLVAGASTDTLLSYRLEPAFQAELLRRIGLAERELDLNILLDDPEFSDVERRYLSLYLLEGRTWNQISALEGVSFNTIRWRITRGLEKLKQKVDHAR